MSIMLTEIKAQPEILARLGREAKEEVEELAARMKERGTEFIVFAARGTSDHAAIFGQYFLSYLTGLPVALAAPSLVTIYRRPLRLAKALVIGISQSGAAADVAEYLAAARSAGALTALVTNNPRSPMAAQVDHLLLCRAGEEQAVAATKTYTAEMALLAMLGLALAGDEARAGAFAELPAKLRKTLALEEAIKAGVERYAFMEECLVLARGLNQATALEAALKIQETSRIGAKGFSAADFAHGPIALVRPQRPVLLFAPDGVAVEGLLEMATKIRERGAELIVFSDLERALAMGRTAFRLPPVAEVFSPFTCIVAAQLFACFLALSKGLDPAHPEGLTKVTVTR
ncbi:MAG: SIS domain-containing protein [Firmicutes bacterium]|nr:SIS domain-containing protein [Bacillota bacterium]